MIPKSAAKHEREIKAASQFSDDLATAILACHRAARSQKVAKPEVLEESVIYLKITGDPTDPRMMDLSFYSPKLRKTDMADSSYKIEVGDWDIDKNFSEKRVRTSLNRIAVPAMRGDVLEADHALLEKVIRQLRVVILQNAVTYFSVPQEQKRSWRNIIKLDVTRYQDVKVMLTDDKAGQADVVQ